GQPLRDRRGTEAHLRRRVHRGNLRRRLLFVASDRAAGGPAVADGHRVPAPMIRVPFDELLALVHGVFERCGMCPEDANLLADSLVQADLRGVNSHGAVRVPEYVEKLTKGGVDPRGRPRIARDGGACLVVDGGNSMGQIGASYAMGLAIERAAHSGIAAVAGRGSNHCGAMAYYAMRALAGDLIGLAATHGLPTLAPR